MSFESKILLRMRLAYLVVLLLAMVIVYKIAVIQYADGRKWKKKAAAVGLKYIEVKATRGNIYSDNGSLLATSQPFYQLAFDPSIASTKVFNDGVKGLSERLARYYGDYSAADYRRRIIKARRAGRKYMILNRKQINYQAKKKMSTWPIFRQGRMEGGVIFEKIDKRCHPFFRLADRTIGTVDKSQRGIVGLEYSFNEYLQGQNGKELRQKIAGGSWMPVYSGVEVKAKDGLDIVTTLHVNFQDIAETALNKALVRNDADYGCVILMEVSTGKIKAIANLKKHSSGRYLESYNYAVGSQGAREPGSTFKLASMIALLEESSIGLYDSIDAGTGEHQFYDQVMRDHKPGGYGKLAVHEVFEKSSNIGMAKLIVNEFEKKPEAFVGYLSKIGLTKPLGFQLVGEGRPYVKKPSDEDWSGITLPWMSQGYELMMTPLQTLTLYNAVANGGKMMQPLLVTRIQSADHIFKTFKSKIINKKICSETTLRQVQEMLKGVVKKGTAKNIDGGYYQVAGKTGTAKHVKNGKYINRYYTSFAGYFPADRPKYSCIVVIDNPKGFRIYGSDVSAPVFKEIADKIYAVDSELQAPFEGKKVVKKIYPVIQSGVYDHLNLICNALGVANTARQNTEWVKARIYRDTIRWSKLDTRKNRVPDVRGMTLRDAIYLLENKKIKVNYTGSGRVKYQSAAPGASARSIHTIKLKLG